MNLAIRDIDGQIGHGDTFLSGRRHPESQDRLHNPPFKVSDWGGKRLARDKRWQCGPAPKGNANFAWAQHIVQTSRPRALAGFLLPIAQCCPTSRQRARLRLMSKWMREPHEPGSKLR